MHEDFRDSACTIRTDIQMRVTLEQYTNTEIQMRVPVEQITNTKPHITRQLPPVYPEDPTWGDYDVMRDLYYLKRNSRGDPFFTDLPIDRYYITPRGEFLVRNGPKGLNPANQHIKSLNRCGSKNPHGYWVCKVAIHKSVMIHHLVYAAFGDMSKWDGIRLDHHPDRSRDNNYIHNLHPSTPQKDAFGKQIRNHSVPRHGGHLYRNNKSGATGLSWCGKREKPGWLISIRQNKKIVYSKWLRGEEYPNDDEGKRNALREYSIARKDIFGIVDSEEDEEEGEGEGGDGGVRNA